MSRIITCGFEWNSVNESGLIFNTGGTAVGSVVTSPVRSGTYAGKVDSAAGNSTGWFAWPGSLFATATNYYIRFRVRFPALPGAALQIFNSIASPNFGVYALLNTDGTVTLGPTGGTSTEALTVDTWHKIEFRFKHNGSLNAGDGELIVNGTNIGSLTGVNVGTNGVPAPGIGLMSVGGGANNLIYFDDITINSDAGASPNNTWPTTDKLVLLRGASDGTINAWTKPGGGTTTLVTSIDNQPPVGVADSTASAQAENMIRNPTSNTSYSEVTGTYTAAGLASGDTINETVACIAHAAPVATGAKTGSLGITANPTGAAALSFGNYHTGTNQGTFPTGWAWGYSTPDAAPSVTKGTGATVIANITGGTASRIASICAMGVYVDYTLAVSPAQNSDWPNPRALIRAPLLANFLGAPLALLAVPTGPAPFYLDDWPNPRGYPFPIVARTFLVSAGPNLASQDQFFGAPGQPPSYDWPNPRGGHFPYHLRTHLGAHQLLLDGQDTFFGAPGQVPTFDWPLPRASARPPQGDAYSSPLALLASLLSNPFFQSDWPNPLRPRQVPLDVMTGAAAVLSALTQKPFSLNDWPNPSAVRRLAAHLDANYALIASTLFAPFSQTDWPNPRGRVHQLELRTFLDGLKLLLAGQDQFFGAPGQGPHYEWPNPARARGLDGLSQGVPMALLSSGPLAYILNASPGVYTLSGIAAALRVARSMNASPGSYTVTGSASALLAARLLNASPGVYTVSGISSSLRATRLMNASAGSYTVSGAATALRAARLMNASAGAYAISGSSAALLHGYALNATPGAYAVSGSAAQLLAARLAKLSPGSYAVTGDQAMLTAARLMNASPGSYTLTGDQIAVLRNYRLSAAAGAYTVNGAPADLSQSGTSGSAVDFFNGITVADGISQFGGISEPFVTLVPVGGGRYAVTITREIRSTKGDITRETYLIDGKVP